MNVGIVGATGMVGQNFLQLLEERSFPINILKLFASKKNEGKTLHFRSQELTIQSLDENSFNNLDIVFFSAGEKISQKWAPIAAQKKVVVIDNSSAFRMDCNTPLVVPEINGFLIQKKTEKGSIIANPNCSTIQLVMALHPLHTCFELESAHVSTYQSLSGAGKSALSSLKEESLFILKNEKTLFLTANTTSSAFNCIPQIGHLNEQGFSTEEAKLMKETKKILNLPQLKITATAVRVPTFNGHGEAVIVTFKKSATKKEIINVLMEMKGLKVLPEDHLAHQRFVDGSNDIYLSRLRSVPDEGGKSWMMWIAADNLRKGAALNGLQIAESLIKQN